MKKSKKNRTANKARKVKATKNAPRQASAGKARAEGKRLFKLAGRPTEGQFVLVYGERGPKMTWQERAKAGVPAAKFQATLAAKQWLPLPTRCLQSLMRQIPSISHFWPL
jgi:hypothetical protein